MDSPPANVRRHFLNWDQPLLKRAVAFLAGAWEGQGPLDLSRLMVILPTRQSGRRLREALAGFAAIRRQAVFAPQVLTPEAFVSRAVTAGVASPLEALLAWTEVFRGLELEEFRDVFPVDPPERTFTWAVSLARQFIRLQAMLGEAGLTLAGVTAKAGGDFPEIERWRQIAMLERMQAERLAALGRSAGPAARLAAGDDSLPPAGVDRIVLLATPDPLPLALTLLARQARVLPVDVAIFAPEEEAASFDDWGRPLARAWAQRVLALPDFESRVRLCADPAEQAERTVAVARGYGDSTGVLGIGVADPEALPLLERAFRQAGLAAFNPEGRVRQGDGLFQLLAALAGLARADSFAAVATLARCPDFLEYLHARHRENFSAADFLASLDELHAAHLPADLTAARRHAPNRRGLDAVAELRATLTTGAFPRNAATALGAIFAARRFDLGRPVDALAAGAAAAWAEVMREVGAVAGRFSEVKDGEWWEVALDLFGESKRTDEKPDGAVELQGWLELLWEDAPHLVVAGLNDGCVPEAVAGDPFLPESLRERLGLKTNGARFARDAYLLQALASSRGPGGRLDLLLGKTSAAGDPLRPSRLLLRCPEAELPRRIAFLFGQVEAAQATSPWRRAWRLEPRRVAPPARVAVTALRAWLDCPFRFYLARVLRMEAVDPAKTELDALDFGILCHAALEAMGGAPALRDCTEANVLREFLLATVEREAAQRFGTELTLPLIVQLESARQRLSRAADVQAQARAEGWVIVAVERKFEIEVGGLVVSGKIDRIDRHERTGAVRVLDYKTSDQPVQPGEAHLRPARREETARDFARWASDGERGQVWCDLQLPLYLRAIAAEFPGPAECGYFNLPKAATETAIARWEGYTPELAASAWRCAEGVAAAIRAGEFWPPNENVRADRDAFATLFHRGVADSVVPPGTEVPR